MTLTETMIAMCISTLITMATISAFTVSSKAAAKAYVYNKSLRDARLLEDSIRRDAQATSGLDTAWNDGTTTHSGANTLILQVPRIGANGDITSISSTVVDRIVYEPSPSNPKLLCRLVFPGAGSSRTKETLQTNPPCRTFGNAYGSVAYYTDNANGADRLTFQYLIQRTVPLHKIDPVTHQDTITTVTTPVSGTVRLRNKRL